MVKSDPVGKAMGGDEFNRLIEARKRERGR
jgi:hypothetical protein